ncbi:hypothetical protein HHI36_005065 [Cryptolaemus montrouzieri]|uniref:Uncharacterized protein n=1 Tax=Cryptolaemus montrouzieri TaxID=559131 RepID=A0ABD2NTA3_9CUCU
MPANYQSQRSYAWKECDDFQIPDDSVWFGKDDDGSDIYCGKAIDDGQEVPAKIIPARRECRVRCDNGEKTVTNCRKVLICGRSKDHCRCRRRSDDCCRTDCDSCSSSSESEDENNVHSKTTSSSANECRLLVKNVKSRSNSTTVTVKKNKKKSHKKKHRRECWDEQRTRVVPKVTYEPVVRYEPKVTMERKVRYENETYTTRVCADRSCCEPCRNRRESCDSRESSVDVCRSDRKCREALICERSCQPCVVEKEERCIRPERCDSPPRSRGKCW